jgi:serine protease
VNLVDAYDFVNDGANGDGTPGRDDDPFDLDSNRHGSHVAGIVAAQADNGEGIAGVAYEATILPLRVLGPNGEGTDADVVAAIRYAAGLSNSSGRLPAQRADIINLSLGSEAYSQTLEDAVNAAIDAGVIVVGAAGNNGVDQLFYPAAYERVIAVSSVTDQRTLSGFSNRGAFIDIAAPGGTGFGDYLYDGFQDGILSTVQASEYAELVGTSMAAPHVSGVLALMVGQRRAQGQTLSPVSVQTLLVNGELSDDLGQPERFGAGLISATRAVQALGIEIPNQLDVFPSQLGFIGADTFATLTLSNPGAGNVTVNVSEAEPWLELVAEPDAVDPSGLGRYRVNIDRSSLGLLANASGTITLSWQIDGVSQPDRRVEVFVSGAASTPNQVGQVYIYLLARADVDAAEHGDAIDVRAAVNGVYRNGRYEFGFVDIEPGEYYLEASTDNDGDYYLYDNGEARGAYPLRSLPSVLRVVDADLSELRFDVGYDVFAASAAQGVSRGVSLRQGRSARTTRLRRPH